jgi:hypothetical protein
VARYFLSQLKNKSLPKQTQKWKEHPLNQARKLYNMDNEKEKLELERQRLELEKMRLELERQKFEFEKEKQKFEKEKQTNVNQTNAIKQDKDEDVKKDDSTNNNTITDNTKRKGKEIQFSEIQEGMEIVFHDNDGNLLSGKIQQVYLNEQNKIIGCGVETSDSFFDLSIDEDKIYLPAAQTKIETQEKNEKKKNENMEFGIPLWVGWVINALAWIIFIYTFNRTMDIMMGVASGFAFYIGLKHKNDYLMYISGIDTIWMLSWGLGFWGRFYF